METSLGVRPFDRLGEPPRIDRGQRGAAPAAAMLHAEDEARRVIAEIRDGSKAKLIVGANTTGHGMYLLPRIPRAFRAAQPSVELVLDIDATDQIRERIHAKQIDLGAGRRAGRPPPVRRAAGGRRGGADRLPDHLAGRCGGHPARALAAEQRLIVAEPRLRTRAGRVDAAPGLRVQPAIELIGTEAVKKAVEANLGVAFVSAYAIERELR